MLSSKVGTSPPSANTTGPVNQQRRDNASCRADWPWLGVYRVHASQRGPGAEGPVC